MERKTANGNYVAYACGPLKRPRYINERIEQELIEFKKEIEDRFQKSKVNSEFKYPRVSDPDDDLIVFKNPKAPLSNPIIVCDNSIETEVLRTLNFT